MGALSNLRVLDLTQVLAGPYCTMLLADMGADVVKIERPGGDLIRSNPPFAADGDDEAYGGYFQSVNRGKRSVELDFGDDADREAFLAGLRGRRRRRELPRGDDGEVRSRLRNTQRAQSGTRLLVDSRVR